MEIIQIICLGGYGSYFARYHLTQRYYVDLFPEWFLGLHVIILILHSFIELAAPAMLMKLLTHAKAQWQKLEMKYNYALIPSSQSYLSHESMRLEHGKKRGLPRLVMEHIWYECLNSIGTKLVAPKLITEIFCNINFEFRIKVH